MESTTLATSREETETRTDSKSGDISHVMLINYSKDLEEKITPLLP
jgi:hypothetical protein